MGSLFMHRLKGHSALAASLVFGFACLLAGCGVTPGPGLLSPVVWVQQYGAQRLSPSIETFGYAPEAATALAADSAGSVVVAGYVSGNFAGYTGRPGLLDAYLTKYDSDGNKLWLQQIGLGLGTLVGSVATDSSKNIIAVGSVITSASSVQGFVSKLDPQGKPLWFQAIPGLNTIGLGQHVDVEADGSIIVTGLAIVPGSIQESLYGAKLAGEDGHTVWEGAFPLGGYGFLTAMALDPSGDALVTGIFTVSPLSAETFAYAAKVDQATGSLVWVKLLNAGTTGLTPLSITSDAQGNPLLGGSTSKSPFPEGYGAAAMDTGLVIKLSEADGSVLWQKTYGTKGGDAVTGIEVNAAGTIYALGYTNGHFNFYDTNPDEEVFILTLSADGTQEAAHQFGAGPLVGAAVLLGPLTAMDTSGNIFVSGATTNAFPGFTNDSHALQMFIAKLTPRAP